MNSFFLKYKNNLEANFGKMHRAGYMTGKHFSHLKKALLPTDKKLKNRTISKYQKYTK